MIKIVPKALISVALLLGMWGCVSSSDDSLRELDNVLANKAFYEKALLDRTRVLNEICQNLEDPNSIYDIRKRIAVEFSAYSLDSTVFYLSLNRNLAIAMGWDDLVVETDIILAQEYINSGFHLEGREIVETIDYKNLTGGRYNDYFALRLSLAGESLAYSSDKYLKAVLEEERESCRDILFENMPVGSWKWNRLKMERAWLMGDIQAALDYAKELTRLVQEPSREYATGCYYCYMYSPENDPAKLDWLIKSVITDIKCGTRDYAALNTLAELLYARGDVDRAFRYAAYFCMPDAISFGGKLRPWQVAQFFPAIEQAYQEKQLNQNRNLRTLIGVLSCMVFLIGLMLILLYQRQKMLEDTRKKLALSFEKLEQQHESLKEVNQTVSALNSDLTESNKLKESFIALFLSMFSENIVATRQYKNHVLKYIRMGAVSNLAQEIESLPPMDEDIAQFYKMFDKTFNDLYPNFVEKFNGLLREGEAIYPKGDDILTPELRIFALIKMGITDSSKIASLLHYSANTVYNYRAKLKNKAAGDRNKFEENVRDL